MKKMLSLAVLLCLLVSVCTPTLAFAKTVDSVPITFDNVNKKDFDTILDVEPGEDGMVTVRVSVTNIAVELDAFSANVVYDASALTLLNGTFSADGELDCIVSVPNANWENLCHAADGCVSLITCINTEGSRLSDNASLVFELMFQVTEGYDSTQIEIPQDSVSAVDRELNYRYGNGCFAVITFSREPDADMVVGDANGDGTVDGTDAIRLLRYLAEYDPVLNTSTIHISEGADVNGDGIVDGRDSVKLLRYLANFDPTV